MALFDSAFNPNWQAAVASLLPDRLGRCNLARSPASEGLGRTAESGESNGTLVSATAKEQPLGHSGLRLMVSQPHNVTFVTMQQPLNARHASKLCNLIFPQAYDLTRHEGTIHDACKIKVLHVTSAQRRHCIAAEAARQEVEVIIVITHQLWINTHCCCRPGTARYARYHVLLCHCSPAVGVSTNPTQPAPKGTPSYERKQIYLSVPSLVQTTGRHQPLPRGLQAL